MVSAGVFNEVLDGIAHLSNTDHDAKVLAVLRLKSNLIVVGHDKKIEPFVLSLKMKKYKMNFYFLII